MTAPNGDIKLSGQTIYLYNVETLQDFVRTTVYNYGNLTNSDTFDVYLLPPYDDYGYDQPVEMYVSFIDPTDSA
jgi:hypothetical protein